MKVAYSNQAFEYWFLLHYNLFQGPMHRNLYAEKLSGLLGIAYSKDAGFASQLFRVLANKQDQAIRNAKAIMRQMENVPPTQAESSTTVHLLVGDFQRGIVETSGSNVQFITSDRDVQAHGLIYAHCFDNP